jgi:D-alanine transaminase
LVTPPKGPKLLSGVTRDKVLQAACAAGVRTSERRLTKAELGKAEEIFLTSTTAEVVPVVAVDGQKVGAGVPGPVAARVYAQFLKMFAQP